MTLAISSFNPLQDTKAGGSNGIYDTKINLIQTALKAEFDSLGVKYQKINSTFAGEGKALSSDSLIYFYHPDHLGSSSLITGGNGAVLQHIEYVPYGEVFVEEKNASWSTPYKFNAKELDEETGLYYYGARYYDPKTSVWISVDPLAEVKPWFSGYTYCLANPINYIDPTGRIERDAKTNVVKFQAVLKYGYRNDEIVFAGDGELSGIQVRGTIGRVYANDGKTFLTVLRVEEESSQYYNDDKHSYEYGWKSLSNADKCKFGTNCLGTVLLDNLYLPLNPSEVDNFLKADGYISMKAKNAKYKIGDIISFNGYHFIRAIGKSKKGDLIWESRMAGDTRITGSLKEILEYNDETFQTYNDVSNATLYRPTEGDKYVNSNGEVLRQDSEKKIWINQPCRNE